MPGKGGIPQSLKDVSKLGKVGSLYRLQGLE